MNAERDYFYGGANSDKLYGGTREDSLCSGSDVDSHDGDDAADQMDGCDGIDWLNGGLGDDKLVGGLGNDMCRIDGTSDYTIVEAADCSIDPVYLSDIDNTLAANVENIITAANIISSFPLNGNGLANTMTGAQGADIIYGLAGNDVSNRGAGRTNCLAG